jgi:hypothetical protein
MDKEALSKLISSIVANAKKLKDKHTRFLEAPVNYSAVFSQSETENKALLSAAAKLGKIWRKTPTGPIFLLNAPLTTAGGKLRLIKIRSPDPTRPERGDADFTVPDYPVLKKEFLGRKGVRLIERPEIEMIEITDQAFDVRVYFSDPPIDNQLDKKTG